MHNNFRKIFFPTEEEKVEQKKKLAEIHAHAVADRENVVLIPYSDGILYVRKPFGGFLGDCVYCSHYYDPGVGFVTGGDCTLHNIGCGYGFTCKNNDSKWAIKISEEN